MNVKKMMWWLSGGAVPVLPDDAVIVFVSIGQSNSNGRAEADRLAITTWPLRPVNSSYYVKTDYLSTDNGSLQSMWIGGPSYEEPDNSAQRLFASDAILTSKLRALFGKDTPIYHINGGEGGTFIVSPAAARSWQEAENECFDRCFNGMYLPAIADIEAAYPTREIKVVVLFHSGESEAIAGGANLTNFPAALQSLMDSMDGVDSYLAAAPWLFTKIYYNVDVNEATINGHIQTFVDGHSDRCYVVDISDQPRKVDLTTEQKAGVTPTTGSDDEHTSYIGQIRKATLQYPQILNYFNWPNNDISEITDNTEFDPSVYVQSGKTAFRLQMNRDNMTITAGGGTPGDENKITDVLDDLGLHDWTVGGTISGRLKNQVRKGLMYFPIGASEGATRVISPVALSNSLFNDGGFIWSVGGYMKFAPNTSGGSPAEAILSTTDAYSGTRSNILIYKTATEELRCEVRCASSTVKIAETDLPVFATGLNVGDQQFIHWCVTSNGANLKIFIDGVEVALDATNNGSLSGITPGNFNNAVNGVVIGARQTGASTFDFHAMGEMREMFGFSSIALSAAEIQNLMIN